MVAVQDPTGKVFCLLPDEPFMFDPFQLKAIQEVTRKTPGSGEEYVATQLSWVDGTWTHVKTSFDDIVEAITNAWERAKEADRGLPF